MPMIVAKMIVPRKLIILLVLGSSPGQATRVRVSEPNRGAGAMLLRPLRDGHIRSITIRLIGRPAGNGEAYVERAASDHTLARAVAIATSPDLSSPGAGLVDTGARRCGGGILRPGYDSSAEVAREGAGPRVRVGVSGSSGRLGCCSAGDGERAEPVEAVEDEAGPGCVGGQVQRDAAGVAGGLGGQGEDP
jgi:hypothetical protein